MTQEQDLRNLTDEELLSLAYRGGATTPLELELAQRLETLMRVVEHSDG